MKKQALLIFLVISLGCLLSLTYQVLILTLKAVTITHQQVNIIQINKSKIIHANLTIENM